MYIAIGASALSEVVLSAGSVCMSTPSASLIVLTDEPAPVFDSVGAVQSRLRRTCPAHELLSPQNADAFCAPVAPLSAPRLLVLGVTMSEVWSHWERSGHVSGHRFDAVGAGRFAKPVLAELSVVPRCLEHVLVLDTDVLAGRDLSQLWLRGFSAFGPSQLLMAKLHQVGDLWTAYGGQKACEKLRDATINSGVMLLDLGRMRRTRWVAHVMSQLSSNRTDAEHCALVRNGTLCSGDQLVLSAACGTRRAACEHFLSPDEHAEYCFEDWGHNFADSARANNCSRTQMRRALPASHPTAYATHAKLHARNWSLLRLREKRSAHENSWWRRQTYGGCQASAGASIFHYNCRNEVPFSVIGAPSAIAQASIDRFYALSEQHGWDADIIDSDLGKAGQGEGQCFGTSKSEGAPHRKWRASYAVKNDPMVLVLLALAAYAVLLLLLVLCNSDQPPHSVRRRGITACTAQRLAAAAPPNRFVERTHAEVARQGAEQAAAGMGATAAAVTAYDFMVRELGGDHREPVCL